MKFTSVAPPTHAAAGLATRLAFLVAGFSMACWAPLVPFAKQRLDVDEAALGLLLLCIGIGSVVAMLATAPVSARSGSKLVILGSGLSLPFILPILSVVRTEWGLALALLAFGGALGALDVAVNVHAVEVERASGRKLMSGFHAFFSIGGFVGSALMTFLLSLHVAPLSSTLLCSAAMAVMMVVAWPRLLANAKAQPGPLFVMPRGIILLLAALAAVTFLVEGAILDWGALLATGAGRVSTSQGGISYMLFAIAMTAGRLVGDGATAYISDRNILTGGGLLSVAGFVVLLTVPANAVAMAGFLLIGLGASNIVPVLLRQAGQQRAIPPALAIGAVTTAGYTGILVGPGAVGFVAKAASLEGSFWLLAALLCLVPLSAHLATRSPAVCASGCEC